MRAAWLASLVATLIVSSGCEPPASLPQVAKAASQPTAPNRPAPRVALAGAETPSSKPADDDEVLEPGADLARLPPVAEAADARAPAPLSVVKRFTDPLLGVGTLLPAEDNYARQRIGQAPFHIPAWAKHLKDLRIALDPGHGGDAHERGYKRGPTGVREAEINLRLAQFLAEFLRAAGAQVLLTRTDDSDVSLEERARIANRWPADIFVSLHHNAMPKKPGTNYSSVWHHGGVDHCLASLDLARYLADGLHDSLELDQVTDVPVKSDLLMYPGGFAVLRAAAMPAALCECSFYSNPDEEQRLRSPDYVLREAHGLFLALARYAHAGLPRIKLLDPPDGVVSAKAPRTLLFELDDGLRRRKGWGWQRRMLLEDSIVARVNGRRVTHELLPAGAVDRVRVTLPADLCDGAQEVELTFQNQQKNSVLNPRCTIELVGTGSTPEPASEANQPPTPKTYYLRTPRSDD